jgi:hypothetical protein
MPSPLRTFIVTAAIGAITLIVSAYTLVDAVEGFEPSSDRSNIMAMNGELQILR